MERLKNVKLARLAMLSSMLALSAPVGSAFALTHADVLGTAADATDFYQVACADDGRGAPASLLVQVADGAPAASSGVSVLVRKGLAAINGTDTTQGGAGSAPVSLNGAAGLYDVFVTKTDAGVRNYTLTYTCRTGANGTGADTGTTIVARQNATEATSPPTNDLFAARLPLTGASGAVAASTAFASREPGEPAHAGNAGGASVWFRWTAPASGQVTLDTHGSAFDTLLGVYTGSAPDALALVAQNDNDGSAGGASGLSFQAVSGQAYEIAVDGLGGASGPLTLTWLLPGASQAPAGPSSPTTFQAEATEGQTADNALRINQGCGSPGGFLRDVIAQSVLFPTQSPELATSDGSPIGDLSEAVVQGSLAGLVHAIQDRPIFLSQRVKKDAAGNDIGFSGTDGLLSGELRGRAPFEFTAPNFVATSCVKRLLIEVAVAEICKRRSTLIGSAGLALGAGTVNLWIPANGSRYAVEGARAGAQGVGDPATLIVNRNVALNPLPLACGGGIDLTVTPAAADVDANLGIPDFWPRPGWGRSSRQR